MITKAEKIHKIKKSHYTKLSLMTILGKPCRRCASNISLCINTVNNPADFIRIISNGISRQIWFSSNKSNHGLINKLNMFLRSASLNIYKIFSNFSVSARPTLTERSFPLQDSMTKYLQLLQTLLPIMYAVQADTSRLERSWTNCSNLLQTRLLVHFVA